ncbi:HNH endonuclease [Candidatus Bathyarchaeota archaeon A05DMB-2]|jgi:nitrate/TMAO reductase-like tetraheme cytochrome c subunit|nr:HNH endonuclease [Candidatus Bathyarchaeota archaeon A05DMB-2]
MAKRKKRSSSVGDFILGKNVENPFKIKPSKNPFGISVEPQKDKRRSFTSTQKKEMLYQQDNKCARCHKKLDPRATHFHHAKPWASGGRTIVINGRALCADCHEIISHKERLRQVDKKRKQRNTNPLF